MPGSRSWGLNGLMQEEYEGQEGSSSAALLGPFTGLRDARASATGRSRTGSGPVCFARSRCSVFSESFYIAAIKASAAVSPSCRSSSFVVSRVRSAGSGRRGVVRDAGGGYAKAPGASLFCSFFVSALGRILELSVLLNSTGLERGRCRVVVPGLLRHRRRLTQRGKVWASGSLAGEPHHRRSHGRWKQIQHQIEASLAFRRLLSAVAWAHTGGLPRQAAPGLHRQRGLCFSPLRRQGESARAARGADYEVFRPRDSVGELYASQTLLIDRQCQALRSRDEIFGGAFGADWPNRPEGRAKLQRARDAAESAPVPVSAAAAVETGLSWRRKLRAR